MSQVPPPVPPQPGGPPVFAQHDATNLPPGYAPSQQLAYAPPPAGVDLRTIAVRQRQMLYCLLGYILCFCAQFLFPPELRFIPMLLAFAVSVAASVFVFMLSIALYNTAAGIVLGLLTLIPFVGMLVLLIINGKATTVLRRHGVRVGLMGASRHQIPAPGTVPYR